MIPEEDVRDTASKLLSNPLMFPDAFKTYLADFVALNIPLIPYSHIFGSRQNIARSGDYIETSETKAATAYGDLDTVGPQLTELADGTYLVAFGCTNRARCALSVNGATPDDNYSLWGEEAGPSSSRQQIVSLKNNNASTIKLQYRDGTFSRRWLIVIRLGAP